MGVRERTRILIEGIVQGVGFRPFIYQVATRYGLAGWVLNDSNGVVVEIEGPPKSLELFMEAFEQELPPLASLSHVRTEAVPVTGETSFDIRQSRSHEQRTAQISPDTFVCDACLKELFDPFDRRYRYPFINCTNCGPRYTIVTDIPYDRRYTTMAGFPMCPDCLEEYGDPQSRRFHAQPNACPVCGPTLSLHDALGQILPAADAVAATVALLKDGHIVAIKGLGGYHLAVDPYNDEAVRRLRQRKNRDEKPFALMVSSLADAEKLAHLHAGEGRMLESVERPIVLLQKKGNGGSLSPLVAPKNGYLGIMLPYTPLHHLLLKDHFPALIMTSANLSDEPIVYEDEEARERLGEIADYFLGHNRPIHTRTDDSIGRVMGGRGLLLRRSRGFVPRGVTLPISPPPILAVGAELKNTVCLTRGNQAYLSQHIGDLKNAEVFDSFGRTIAHLENILGVNPSVVAHDLHPDYYSTVFARQAVDKKLVAVQHHHAHLASCLAENRIDEEVIGVIFDGIGYGEDGHIWGGEFLIGDCAGYRRAGHFDYLPMPGGDAATREPLRMAISYLVKVFGDALPPLPLLRQIPGQDLKLYRQMIARGINSPLTSSCGRLFDAVAALIGLRDKVSYEGQAALELEMSLGATPVNGEYPYALVERDGQLIFEYSPLIRAVVQDVLAGCAPGRISALFHNSLAHMVLQVCRTLREQTKVCMVALSGGVFQNRYLTERSLDMLREDGFTVLTHSLVPPNDGGLSLGQAVVAGRACQEG